MKTLFLVSFAVFLLGCSQTLQKDGPYQGDKFLYDADQTIHTAYVTLDAFVTWEKQNAPLLTAKPEIHVAAERIRLGAPQWFKSAVTVRDAYAINPTPEARKTLGNAINIIQAALLEVAQYMPKDPVVKKPLP